VNSGDQNDINYNIALLMIGITVLLALIMFLGKCISLRDSDGPNDIIQKGVEYDEYHQKKIP